MLLPGELTAPLLVPPPPPPPPPPVPVAAGWLLQHGGASVQFRTMRDLLQLSPLPVGASRLPFAGHMGWHLLGMADGEGLWPGGVLATPSGRGLTGVGTIPAYRRLLELGWDADAPPLSNTRRFLFRALAQDSDPSLLAELRPQGDDEDRVLAGRLRLREAAAAALAHAGYEQDPRLRGAARRLIDRVHAFLRSPLAERPWIRRGNQHLLDPEAAPPSFDLLVMLAWMPNFRSEHREFMDRLVGWITQPWPRQTAMQEVGGHLSVQSQLVLGDPLATRPDLDADMPSALAWLELMARLGLLMPHEGWLRLLDRALDDRSRKGIWTPPRSVVIPETVPAWSWPALPLTDPGVGGDPAVALSADVTFRLGLIARLAGREIVWS